MLNSKLRKSAIELRDINFNKYNSTVQELENKLDQLYESRLDALILIEVVRNKINQLANSPRDFQVKLEKIKVETASFLKKEEEIQLATREAKLLAGGTGAAASLSALGLAVATIGPTAAMGIATTFGVASTGTAISTLSGAAATNAALAWLGGGTLVAGGGGMAAGSLLLTLINPVGWAIAGISAATSIGTGIKASKKNKEQAKQMHEETLEIQKATTQLSLVMNEVSLLHQATIREFNGIALLNKALRGAEDYQQLSSEERYTAAALVNSTLALAELVNKELEMNASEPKDK